jgi:hypothetical protein
MGDMRRAAVTKIEDGRDRRVSRAMAARRRLDSAPFPRRVDGGERRRAGGRVWVNGVEVGGTDPRHSTLALPYD